eukprot:TRINITY_DN849_c1_g1_i1.p1 TRINITY_DN849_c1_g1~~TRINITY_DN849_c1_g1_i1.p1  ORF type:complete len:792 (-),score=101.40 TRINITY_DN849_c1_g1_i1:464-2839(-)
MSCCGPAEKDFPRRLPDGVKSCATTPKLESRETTDRCCCFVFLICVAGMISLVGCSVYFGEVKRLTHGYDYAGRLCGVDVPEEFVFFCGSKERNGAFPKELDFKSRSCVAQCPNATSVQGIPCMRPPTNIFNELKPTVENGITFEKTYEIDVQQTVELGAPYPTDQLGRYCVPTEQNMLLRNSVLYGPLRHENAFSKLAASFMHAWPVLLFSAVLAVLLGMGFLHLLDSYGGLVIFLCMAIATVALLVTGVFFFLALFIWDVEDLDNWYNKLNPIVHSSMGNDGRFASVFLGMALVACSACMGLTTKTSMPEIDKSIGIVRAALDCIFTGGCCSQLIQEAITKAVVILVQLALCMVGLALVSSVGYIESEGLIINGQVVQGLQASFTWYWGWSLAIAFYVFMMWWLFEVQIARYQFTVTYAVCQWYFVEPKEVPAENITLKTSSGPRQVDVRVGGVDSAPGQRQGVRVKTGNNQEVVVVGVGQKGPRNQDVVGMMPTSVTYKGPPGEKKDMPSGAVCGGNDKSIMYHLGSLAWGAIIVSVTRPFRLLTTAVRALIGKSQDRKFAEEDDPSLWVTFQAMITLLVNIIENTFLGVSKNAYCAIVLGSVNFWTGAREAKVLLEDAGGSVAFLHGSTGLYELIGVALISLLCGVSTMLIFTYIPCFTDRTDASWFVEDTSAMVFASTLISGIIAYGFMSLFNITIDAMLYVFAWSRKMKISKNSRVCPMAMRTMINSSEWEADPDTVGALAQIQPRSKTMAAAHVWHSLNAMGSKAYESMRGTPTERNPLLSTAP